MYNVESYGSVYTQTAGPLTITAVPLHYSQNAVRQVMYGLPGIEPNWLDRAQFQSGAAMPSLSKQKVYAVEGWILVQPAVWTAGSALQFGARLMYGEQENTVGNMITYTGYSMWTNTAQMDAAQAANIGYLKEWRLAEVVPSVAGIIARGQWLLRCWWSFRNGLTLDNDNALFLLVETAAGSVQARFTPYLRVLMKAPQG